VAVLIGVVFFLHSTGLFTGTGGLTDVMVLTDPVFFLTTIFAGVGLFPDTVVLILPV